MFFYFFKKFEIFNSILTLGLSSFNSSILLLLLQQVKIDNELGGHV